MAATPRTSTIPAPGVLRQADLLVLALVLVALLLGWLIRQQAVGASELVTLNGVELALPAGAVASSDTERQAVTTSDGLTVAVTRLPAPPIGTAELQPLIANRALQQSQSNTLYRVIETTFVPAVAPTAVDSISAPTVQPTAAVNEYVYVQEDNNPLAPSGLTVIHGREVLFVRNGEVYVVSVEGAEAQWADVEQLWPDVFARVTRPTS